jgi:hypothetical protein
VQFRRSLAGREYVAASEPTLELDFRDVLAGVAPYDCADPLRGSHPPSSNAHRVSMRALSCSVWMETPPGQAERCTSARSLTSFAGSGYPVADGQESWDRAIRSGASFTGSFSLSAGGLSRRPSTDDRPIRCQRRALRFPRSTASTGLIRLRDSDGNAPRGVVRSEVTFADAERGLHTHAGHTHHGDLHRCQWGDPGVGPSCRAEGVWRLCLGIRAVTARSSRDIAEH